jgi:protease-4
MAENGERWEREVLEKLATAALGEQRKARRWGIFFKLLTFAYLTFFIVLAVDWKQLAEPAERHTALVEINGLIAPGGDASAERVITALNEAFKNKKTQGVVLRVNSPGGSPVQAQAIYDEMRRLRAKHPEIPLYAVVEDLCASGGYYAAVGAERIFVGRASIVGSIGVRMDGFGVTGLMEKLGIERRLLVAGDNKGMLDPFLPLDERHREHAQALMDEIHQQFIAAVREGRGERLKEAPEIFSGLIWSGTRSIELGLADALGGLDHVAREVVKAENIVDFTQKENLAEKFARRFGVSVAAGLMEIAARLPTGLR